MTLRCYGVRGATIAESNTREAIVQATGELLERMTEANGIRLDDVAAVWFTTTPDLNAEFPAVAARRMGWEHVALLCGHEMAVPGVMQRVVRVLMLVNTEKSPRELVNIYLNETRNLRNRGTE